eukprot:CAMPEP_0117428612 /NCGR_PEP_ID=MMETSP0758-20121206/8283_1 /TAXON_ID=63605 /ORGANISM="Percolomonas cosmopolitus, Strain AE-1 (ATCC 50343)" /LENGTH=312 /DNA_ID=CAMNT_0005215069 /DNA_START=305 /DNA_END=1243 /DNA_ORIENTATION=+
MKRVNAELVKHHFTTVYQLLDEMIDNGFPITTELSLLFDLVRPPQSLLNGLSRTQGKGGRSMVPWRKKGIKYSNNQIFFDVVEELNCIVGANGNIKYAEAFGTMHVNCRLGAMPDVELRFVNPEIIEDISFHPCIRLARYEQSKILSFIPPDGEFDLINYRIEYNETNSPVYCTPQITGYKGGARVTLNLKSKMASELEDVKVFVPFDIAVTDYSMIKPSRGSISLTQNGKLLTWNLGKIPANEPFSLSGTISTASSHVGTVGAVRVKFIASSKTFSGLKVEKVVVKDIPYKDPYKGVRYRSVAGRYEVRNS